MRSLLQRRPLIALGVGSHGAAIACAGVAYVKRDAARAEGAYFNRSVGEDAAAVAFASEVRPWLVAVMVLIAAGTSACVIDALRRL